MKTFSTLFTLLLLAAPAMAKTNLMTECRYGEQLRVIEVVYSSEAAVPCEVTYTKETGTEVLWRAYNQEGYCEEKASSLVSKQQEWGWQCQEVNTP